MSNEQSFIRNVNALVSKLEELNALALRKEELSKVHSKLDELLGAIAKYESLKAEAQRFNENKENLTVQIREAKETLLREINGIKEPLISEVESKLLSLKDRLKLFAVDLEIKAEKFETRNEELLKLYEELKDELSLIDSKIEKVAEFKAYFDSTKASLEEKSQIYQRALDLERQIKQVVDNFERIEKLVDEYKQIEDIESIINQAKRLDLKDELRYKALDLKVDMNYAKSIALFKSLKGE